MNFKYRKSIKLSYRWQGYIFFLCQNIDRLTMDKQQKILVTCNRIGHADAVFEYITTEASSKDISQRYNVSEKMLSVKTAAVFEELARMI